MDSEQPSQTVIGLIRQLKNKRAKIVAEHLLKYGSISTEEITTLYGYKHPPRAVRDLREAGIPIQTISAIDADGKTIAAYQLGNLEDIRQGRLAGRKTFPKTLKKQLFQTQAGRCAICNSVWEMRYLQIDHRIPYEIGGDDPTNDVNAYQLVCAECNRAKSWSCEHCPNFSQKDKEVCGQCYWASPTDYQHIATSMMKRLVITWEADEITDFEALRQQAEKAQVELVSYIKNRLK